jgi:hypothetical protein
MCSSRIEQAYRRTKIASFCICATVLNIGLDRAGTLAAHACKCGSAVYGLIEYAIAVYYKCAEDIPCAPSAKLGRDVPIPRHGFFTRTLDLAVHIRALFTGRSGHPQAELHSRYVYS